VSPQMLRRAMLEVASVTGVSDVPLRDHPYLGQLADRVVRLSASTSATALADAVRATESAADVAVRFGAWHGDWTPWNMAQGEDEVLVWDWEHFEAGVPLGYDVLHHHVVTGARDGLSPDQAFARAWSEAPRLLAGFQDGPREARLVVRLYALDIAARYLRDGEAEGDTRLGDVRRWLLPTLRLAHDEPPHVATS
jgi:hypothetical protein